MLDSPTNRFSNVLRNIRGQAKLTEDSIKGALCGVRLALLEADVTLGVVKESISNVREKALGREVAGSLTPDQVSVGVVNQALIELMGRENRTLDLSAVSPAAVLTAGLQDAGKTTTAGKLARLLKDGQKKKVLVVSADVHRPTAIEQLCLLAEQVGIDFFPSNSSQKPAEIVMTVIDYAKKHFYNVLMVNTVGRLVIDEEMMSEIKALCAAVNPAETPFIVDTMLGQDVASTTRAFNETLPPIGVILARIDGDSRGGATLPVRQIIGKPIKLIGVGKEITGLGPFHPDRTASHVLGMGDVLSLVEDIQKGIDEEAAAKMAKKLQKGKGFDLNDFKEQIQQMHNMGGLESLMSKMPDELGQTSKQIPEGTVEKVMGEVEAIIDSMTPKEHANPALPKASRKYRITVDVDTNVQEVNKLLKQFEQSQQMMKIFNGSGMAELMRMAKGAKGMRGMSPGL